MKKRFISLLFCFSLLSSIIIFKPNNYVKAQNGSAEIVIELNTNRILKEHNIHKKMYMASLTKIATAIVIIENCNINDIVLVGKETIGVEGSSIYLEEGEKLTVKELLYGLMLRSGNDCAETLAVFCSKNINDFAKLMNNFAKKIGANNTNFVNPHGLHNDNHYTTAYDLALISSYAMKNDIFREIVSTKTVKISHTNRDYDRVLVNKNKMLSGFDGANGIKTGYTKKAGRCLVSSAKRGDLELISVVLNCGPMFERSKELLNDCFNNYKNYKIVESDNIIDFIKINDKNKDVGISINNDIILPLTELEYQTIKIEYDYPKSINSPVKNNYEIGKITIYAQNNLIFKEKIYTINSVD